MRRNRKLTRRSLLRAAPAALAAPYIVPRALWARRPEPPPSDRVTVGILGCGISGSRWMEHYRLRQYQPLWLCDVDDEHSSRLQSRINRREKGTNTCRDFRKVLADDRVDAVVIATPDHWHAVMACAAARAGKDIYCENPMSLTVREAGQVARLASRWGRVFQTGMYHRYSSSYRRACELVRGGVLGKIREIYAPSGGVTRYSSLGGSGTCPDTLDWDMWLGPAPAAAYNPARCSGRHDGWRACREYSGGSLTSYGVSIFDIVGWFLDREAKPPTEFIPPRREDDKWIPLTVRYADGLTIRGDRGPHSGSVEFVGEKGSLAMGVGEKGFTTWPGHLASADVAKLPESRKFNRDAIRDFGDCVRTRTRPLANAEVARGPMSTAHLACIACWTGRTIKWDPAAGRIVGDDYAARLLDRPKRMPWRC